MQSTKLLNNHLISKDKHMKNYILPFVLVFVFAFKANAQEEKVYRYYDKNQFLIQWEINMPLNSDFVDKTSFNGGRVEYRYMNSRTSGIGASLGWSTTEQYFEGALYQTEGSAVYTDMIRQVRQLPMLATYTKFFSEEGVRPYINVGIGTNYAEALTFFNIYEHSDSSWGFAARPEIGIQSNAYNGWGFYANAAYNYSTNTFDKFPGIENIQGVSYGIGVLWSY